MPTYLRWLGFAFGVLLGIGNVACAHHSANGDPKVGQLTVTREQAPEGAPDEAKTVKVEYAFAKDLVNKDFDKTLKDGFTKKGLKVDETLAAHAHFDVKDAKIVGTVTYVKKGMGRYSILEAELQALGHYDADVKVDVDVAAKGDLGKATVEDWQSTPLGGKSFELVRNVMPTNIPIAGPLFLHVHFDLSAACQMEVNGQMHATAGMGVSGDVKLATRYKKEGFIKADGKKSKFEFEALTPNFQLDPKPYLEVSSRKQQVKGRCALQPTAVLLLEHSVGAKLSVEPYLEMQAQRASSRDRWQLDAQAGLSVHAATDVEVFGRAIGKPKEFTLFEVALTKPGDPVDAPPAPADPPPSNRPTDNAPAAVASNLPGAPKAVPLAAKSGPRLWLPWKKKR